MSATAEAAARHRAWTAPFLAIAIALFIIAGLGWYAVNALTSGLCGSTEISRISSPDGRHDAVLFEHNCGATTDFATHVSVLPAGAELGADGGNAFAAGTGDSGARAAWGGSQVELEWLSDRTLMIRYDDSAKVFSPVEEVEGVTIRRALMP